MRRPVARGLNSTEYTDASTMRRPVTGLTGPFSLLTESKIDPIGRA